MSYHVLEDQPNLDNNGQQEQQPVPVSVERAITPEFVRRLLQSIKFAVYLFSLVAIFVCCFASKSLTLLMTSMAQPNHMIPICVSRCDKRHIEPPLDPNITNYYVKYDVNREARIPWLWLLFLATVSSYVYSFVKFALNWLNQNSFSLEWTTWALVFVLETVQSIGLSLLVFVVLPQLDVIQGAMMMTSVCFVPSLLKCLTPTNENRADWSWSIERACNNRWLSIAICTAQFISVAVWTVIGCLQIGSLWYIAWIPLALVLTSLEWWENYLKPNAYSQIPSWLTCLDNVRRQLSICRHKVYCLISLWKIAVSFGVLTANEYFHHPQTWTNMFEDFSLLQNRTILVVGGSAEQQKVLHFLTLDVCAYWPVHLLLVHLGCNGVCLFVSRYACKICIQRIGFALPINLTAFFTPIILLSLSGIKPCQDHYIFNHIQRPYFYWTMKYDYDGWQYVVLPVIWIVALLSQFGNALHIWKRITERMSKKLFINNFVNTMVIDQSLMMRKRCMKVRDFKVDYEMTIREINRAHGRELDERECRVNSFTDSIGEVNNPIRLYVCVTMWHEKKTEMVATFKSVLLLDFDQATRRIVKDHYRNKELWEYYEMEVHVMFDEAFIGKDEDSRKVNSYVEAMIEAVEEAVGQVYSPWNINMTIAKPTVIATPYGGQLVWQLPSGNKLIAHIKDQHFIRKRKRWSQCMYMHYLLEFQLEHLSKEAKLKRANNTFILTLDGDINFEPSAVDMVLDLMKKNANLGAACGRIHPVGSASSLLVWYQKFEYAIGHWFQKSTEHKFGSVLCSPGCFSLLRGRALMDKVMHQYTRVSSRGLHHVKFDQGEDRWLCNLLIQRGWRIEYCAASDSYTNAPEGFKEFFKQRRRWIPSTMANIVELLFTNPCQTIKINENISKLYILYQICLLVSTTLSPAIVFLIVVSGISSGLHYEYSTSFWLILLPIVAFTIVCLQSTDADLKLNFALILSVLSALLMFISICGNIINMIDHSILSTDALLFVIILACYLLGAILHPQEFFSFFIFPMYILFVPSMYLLLLIYSLTNMNETSWGTRETQIQSNANDVEDDDDQTEHHQQDEEANLDGNSLNNKFLINLPSNDRTQFLCGLFRFEGKKNRKSRKRANQINHETVPSTSKDIAFKPNQEIPFWIQSCQQLGDLKDLTIGKLSEKEENFWNGLIDKFLKPLKEDTDLKEITDQEQRKDVEKQIGEIKSELASLRNKALFFFAICNVIFILSVYMSEMNPKEFDFEIVIGKVRFKIDTSGSLLLIIFGAILIFQIVGMLIHRFTTFCHLLAYTEMECWHPPERSVTVAKNFLQIGQFIEDESEQSILAPNGSLQQINRNTIARDILNNDTQQYDQLEQVYIDRINIFTAEEEGYARQRRLPTKLRKIVKNAIEQHNE